MRVEDALDEMVVRVGNRDLQWIALVARVQHQVGGNMAEMFDIVAETVRQRHRLRAQIHTLTVQGRMTRWILRIAPLALGAAFFVISPDYLRHSRNPTGLLLVGVAVVSERWSGRSGSNRSSRSRCDVLILVLTSFSSASAVLVLGYGYAGQPARWIAETPSRAVGQYGYQSGGGGHHPAAPGAEPQARAV